MFFSFSFSFFLLHRQALHILNSFRQAKRVGSIFISPSPTPCLHSKRFRSAVFSARVFRFLAALRFFFFFFFFVCVCAENPMETLATQPIPPPPPPPPPPICPPVSLLDLDVNTLALTAKDRGVKRNNGVFIIPLFLLKHFPYSIIPAQKFSLFHYSCSKIFIMPLFLPKKHTLFHYSKNKISVILIPLFLFSPRKGRVFPLLAALRFLLSLHVLCRKPYGKYAVTTDYLTAK